MPPKPQDSESHLRLMTYQPTLSLLALPWTKIHTLRSISVGLNVPGKGALASRVPVPVPVSCSCLWFCGRGSRKVFPGAFLGDHSGEICAANVP